MSSAASVIALSDIALGLFSVATIILFTLGRYRFDRVFLVFTWAYLLISIGYFMKFGWINFTASARIYLKVLYAYMTIKIIGNYFFHYFIDVVAKLALISLPLFAIQYFLPDQMMHWNGFMEPIVPQVFKGGADYSNSFLFTVNPWALDRNSGFMWEPGAFAAVLSVAMFLNLVVNQGKVNIMLLVMLVASISTFSTTGIILLFLVVLFYLLNQRTSVIAVGTPITIVLAAIIFMQPDVSGKILDRMENTEHSIQSAEDYEGDANGISVGRFGSWNLDMEDFAKHPFIGFGLQQTERINSRYTDLVRANGFSDFIVKFGILGLLFLTFSLTTSFRRLQQIHGGRAYAVGTLIVLTLAFSNPVLVTPLFFAFQFYYMAIRINTDHPIANA
jgi:hypothetical protein